MADCPEGKISNPFKVARKGVKVDVGPSLTEISHALDAAVRAMDDGAWFSTKADAFYGSITDMRTTLQGVRTNVLADLTAKITPMDDCVEPNSSDAKWRNL